jgi:hypothetical protein
MTLPSCDCISRQNKHQPIVGTGSQLPPKPPSESRGQEIIVTRRDEDRDPAALPTVTQKVQGKPGPTNFSAPSDFHTLITHTHTQQSLTVSLTKAKSPQSLGGFLSCRRSITDHSSGRSGGLFLCAPQTARRAPQNPGAGGGVPASHPIVPATRSQPCSHAATQPFACLALRQPSRVCCAAWLSRLSQFFAVKSLVICKDAQGKPPHLTRVCCWNCDSPSLVYLGFTQDPAGFPFAMR